MKNKELLFSNIYKYGPVIFLCLAAFTFYQILIYYTPTIYWNDAHIRWALRDQLFLGQWLPGIQALVVIVSKTTSELYVLKTLMSFLAIGSLIGIYILASYLFSHETGLIAFMFLACSKMFAAFAIVPYPEMSYSGILFLILVLMDTPVFSRRFNIGLILLNLACLIRYEGWFLALFFILEVSFKSLHMLEWKAAIWQVLKMTLLCSLVPLIWLTFGIHEGGGLFDRLQLIFDFVIAPTMPLVSDHILARLNVDYLLDFFRQFFHLLTSQIRVEFLALALGGFFWALFKRPYRKIHLRILFILLLNWFLLAIFQPWKFGNLRQSFLTLAFVFLYSSHGLVLSVSWILEKLSLFLNNMQITRWAISAAMAVASLMTIGLLPSTYEFVVETSKEYDFYVPYKISTWLSSRIAVGEAILIVNDTDYYPYALATYFNYPLDSILDDRFDLRLIQENLGMAQKVYVIELYRSRDGLSPIEINILDDLESGQIQAERFVFDGGTVWYAPANEILYSMGNLLP